MNDELDNQTVYTLDELRAIIRPLIERYGFRWASLFGSYARGEAKGYSDIDLLVDKGDEKRLLDVCGLSFDLEQSTGKDVDCFDISELKDGPFRETVLREAVAI